MSAGKIEPMPVLPSVETLGALLALRKLPGFGPVKFREMHAARISPVDALENPCILPFGGRTGAKLRSAIRSLTRVDRIKGLERAKRQLKLAKECSASILVHGDEEYPRRVYASNNPVPVLYVRGDPATWADSGSVAVVGSRNIREPYASAAKEFATAAARKGIVVVSGFAKGADSIGHSAARASGGRTVCVMPCGLDSLYPPENLGLYEMLMAYPGAAFASEFELGQRVSSLRLVRRNKLIAAFSQGILIAQSADAGGAMNAYRSGRSQKKPVAAIKSDGSKETGGNARIEKEFRSGDLVLELDAVQNFEYWLENLAS